MFWKGKRRTKTAMLAKVAMFSAADKQFIGWAGEGTRY